MITTILFCFAKFIEMRYLEKEFKSLKVMVRDAVIVFSCALTATYGYFYFQGTFTDFINVVTETKTLNTDTTQIFTDLPGF